MSHNTEKEMPDFASVLCEGSMFQKGDITGDDNEKTDPSVAMKITDLMENDNESVAEELETSSEDDSISDYESVSDTDSSGTESESESEPDKNSVAPETDESGSEYESEDEESVASSESLKASKTIRVGEEDNDPGDESHVYEEDDQDDGGSQEGDWNPPEEEEVCYEATDLGGEDVATASMLAASLVAGSGAVRSGTGWTWLNMFIILSAAGGLGLVLLYAVKRINDLTRLVKTLEENSHMAMNERDVQVITTRVIGDMLEDVEDPPSTKEKTSEPVEEDGVQTEFEKFEQLDKTQSIAEILEAEEPAPKISVTGVVPDEDLGDSDTNDKVAPDILGSPVDDPKESTPDIRSVDIVSADDELSVAKHSSVVVIKEDTESTDDGPQEEDAENVGGAAATDSNLEIDELVDGIETMSLSDERVTTRKSSRLASSSK